jgi:hypothetical protein
VAFIAGHALDQLYVSAVTLAELRFGIELLSEGSSRPDELNNWLTHKIRPMFDQRVLPAIGRSRIVVTDVDGEELDEASRCPVTVPGNQRRYKKVRWRCDSNEPRHRHSSTSLIPAARAAFANALSKWQGAVGDG